MSECTERSEGRESMAKDDSAMSECTERSEGRESMAKDDSAMSEGRENMAKGTAP